MSEWGWFFLGHSIPHIKSPRGMEEFVKYRSKKIFIVGSLHLVFGVVLAPYPDILILFLAWVLFLVPLSLSMRSDFINVALEINRKYARPPRPKKVCQKCGKEMLYDLCLRCGEKLKDQDVSVTT